MSSKGMFSGNILLQYFSNLNCLWFCCGGVACVFVYNGQPLVRAISLFDMTFLPSGHTHFIKHKKQYILTIFCSNISWNIFLMCVVWCLCIQWWSLTTGQPLVRAISLSDMTFLPRCHPHSSHHKQYVHHHQTPIFSSISPLFSYTKVLLSWSF